MTLTLQEKLKEQKYLVDQLEMWAEVQKQGIDPEEVFSFTWRDDFETPAQTKERRKASRSVICHDPYIDGKRPLYYNAVKMQDGTYRRLDPIIKAPVNWR